MPIDPGVLRIALLILGIIAINMWLRCSYKSNGEKKYGFCNSHTY